MTNPLNLLMSTTPLGQMARVMQDGGNPMQIVSQMAQSNPQMRLGLDIMMRQGPQGIEKYARNMCRERGINPEDLIRQMGLR